MVFLNFEDSATQDPKVILTSSSLEGNYRLFFFNNVNSITSILYLSITTRKNISTSISAMLACDCKICRSYSEEFSLTNSVTLS